MIARFKPLPYRGHKASRKFQPTSPNGLQLLAFTNPKCRSPNRSLRPDNNTKQKMKRYADLPLKNETIPRFHDHAKGAANTGQA
jgi:hypothetical protein